MNREYTMSQDEMNDIKLIMEGKTPKGKYTNLTKSMNKDEKRLAFWNALSRKYKFILDTVSDANIGDPTFRADMIGHPTNSDKTKERVLPIPSPIKGSPRYSLDKANINIPGITQGNQPIIESLMNGYDSLTKIVTELESCNFRSGSIRLETNIAFLKLKEMAKNEQ